MSLIFADGFENSSLWSRRYVQNTTVNITSVSGRNGNCMSHAANGPYTTRYNIPSAYQHATIISGFALRTGINFDTQVSRPFFCLLNSETIYTGIVFASGGGGLVAVRGSTNIGSTTSVSFTANTWYYVEVKMVLDDSTGSVEVKVNGTTHLNLTGVDTNPAAGTVYDQVRWQSGTTSNQSIDIDDMYLLNGAGGQYDDFLGDVTVETIRPDGNGNSSQWVGSDADSTDNYLLVDEATYDSADYVQSATTNNKDLYTYGALAAGTGSVKGVVAHGVMQKTASGTQNARQITRIGGTNYNGSSVGLTTTDDLHVQVWEESPATTSDWTISEVNGAEFGVEVL